MSVYTNPPEWEAQGKKPPSSKRTEGWRPGDRVPASWLNWFWFSTVNSLREIAQAFVNHRDASAPHDGHETKEGATAKVEAHSQKITAVHGVGQQYVAKTSRSDQWPSWNDIPDKPSTFPVDAATLPKASTSQAGIVQLTNSRSSNREDLAVTAAALNAHRTSADHDNRYYTKSQVDELVASSGLQWVEPGNTVLASSASTAYSSVWGSRTTLKRFVVFTRPGRYRITGEFRSEESGLLATVRVRAGGVTIGIESTTRSSWKSFSFDTPSNVFLGIGDVIVVEGEAEEGSRCVVRNVRVRGDVSSPPSWVV